MRAQNAGLRTAPIALCAALIIWAGRPADAQAVESTLPNPSVEAQEPGDPTKPQHWIADAWGDIEASFDYLSDGADGRGLRVDVHDVVQGDAKWISDYLDVDGSYALLVGDSYRSDGESVLLVQAIGDGEDENIWISAAVVGPADEWTEVRGLVQLPEWTRTVRLAHSISNLGWLETDEYFLASVSSLAEGQDVHKPGRVSIAFDDGWVSAYHIAVPIMEEFGFRASFYIHTDWVDKPGFQGDYMTSRQLIELGKAGHEIGSHCRFHVDLRQVSEEELITHVSSSKEVLEELGFKVTGFVPPLGAYNDHIIDLVAAEYDYLRTVNTGVNVSPYDDYELRTVVVTPDMDMKDLQAWIDVAVSQGAWLVLLYHRFTVEDIQSPTYSTPETFRATMQYLYDNDVEVLPLGEVLGVWKPESFPSYGLAPPEPESLPQPVIDSGCRATDSPLPGALAMLLFALAGLLLFKRVRRQS